MGSSSQGLTRLEHRREWRCRVASSTSRTSMVVLIKRRIQWRMTNDFSQLSRIGKRSSWNGLIYSYPKNLEGIGKKSKVCGRPNLKGNMLAVRRPHNASERTRTIGLEFSGEVRNHKNGYNGACIGPLQFPEQYHTDIENHKNSFARSCSRCVTFHTRVVMDNVFKTIKVIEFVESFVKIPMLHALQLL